MSISLQQLFDAGRDRLELELICGEHCLDRVIEERVLNRPGLALTGFFQYFAQHRIQVLGLAEFTYLESLSHDERLVRLRELLHRHVPAVILARNYNPFPELRQVADETSTPLFRSSLITSRLINECTLLLEQLDAPRGRLQGTMLEIMGIGVLLQGPAAIGKSETALSLIRRGYSLVADDVTEVVRNERGRISGFANEMTRYHMEIRGVGIVHVPSLYGVSAIRSEADLDLVIQLHPYRNDAEEDRTGMESGSIEVLGVSLPLFSLPVRTGPDMANVVEATAMNYKLKLLGHDAAKELNERVMQSYLRKTGAAV